MHATFASWRSSTVIRSFPSMSLLKEDGRWIRRIDDAQDGECGWRPTLG